MASPLVPDSGTSPETGAAKPRTSQTARITEAREAIAAGNAMFMDAFQRDDPEAIAACYTADGQVLPPNGDIVEGRKALESFWQSTLALGIADAKLETVEVFHSPGDIIATEVGRYSLTAADGQPADRGKYVVIWQCDSDGRWRIHRDIWASNLPLPSPA